MRTPSTWRKVCALLIAFFFIAQTSALAAEPQRTVLVLGDSLSAAYGLSPEQGWVALLGQRLSESHPDWRVVNASVSGETTGGGAARFPRTLEEHAPDIVILELGANDALRGLPLQPAQANLQRIIDAAHAANARVLLAGVEIPPNYGPEYANAFRAMFATLAQENDLAFIPFLLEPIATDLAAFLPDTIHPTAESQPKVLEHVWQTLEPMLD